MSKREAFISSVCKEHLDDFLKFIKLHNEATEPFDLDEVVQEMSKKQRESLWARLASLLLLLLDELSPDHWSPEDRDDAMEVEGSKDRKRIMEVVCGVTQVVIASVSVIQDGDTYTSLLQCATRLNGLLASLPVCEVLLQQAVLRLCEAWWKKGLLGREELGCTVFLNSLEKSFILKKPGAEIQRLWALHEVLLSVDCTSEDSQDIMDLLQRCFLSACHIKHDDGKRLMVFLFSWNVSFIRKIHETIKNQLQFFTKTLTDHIAEIYFRAWKKACGEVLEEMESACIQDFMQHAILLHRSTPVHPRVRQILSYFHKRKGHHNLDEMLHRLYKPILWRALTAANSEVRANATLLFTEAFPVHDPGHSSEKMDETVQKQLDSLVCLLEDPQPLVRSTATLGVCRILAKCWEVIPPTIIADFLKKLVVELASDCSSPDVRCSVYKCLIIVLDNSLSHRLLEQVLPVLKHGLHDSSEKVRAAFLDLLLKIKAVRAAKFWKVCSMEHLLARLAVDSQPISKRIVNLLFNSFFPVNQSEEVWCERCVTLIQMNPKAARKFYQYAHFYTAPTNIAKLMLTIRRCLNACIQNTELNSSSSSNKENDSVLNDVLSLSDTESMASLLEVVVILWRSIRKALEFNKDALQYTVSKFAAVIPKYFSIFQAERCTVSLILLASLMPPAAVPTFSVGVLSRLRNVDPGSQLCQYSQVIDCLCSWGQAADVLELITLWLNEALPKTASKRTGSRKVRIVEPVEAKPDLGIDYLDYLLGRAATRDSILALRQGPLKQLHKALGAWRSVLYSHLSCPEPEASVPSADTALRAFTMHGRVCVHLQHTVLEGRDLLASLENMAAWVAERVLPFLVQPDEGRTTEGQLELARRVVESFLTVSRDLIRVGLGDDEFKGHLLHLCSLVLLSEKGHCFVPLLVSILTEVAENYIPQDALFQEEEEVGQQGGQSSVILGVVANIFQKVLEVLARRMRKEPDDGWELCQAVLPSLGAFLQVVTAWGGVASSPLTGVFATISAAVIVESRHILQKVSPVQELTRPESVAGLPPLSSTLLSAVLASPAVTRAFLSEVKSTVDSEAIDCVTGLAAVLHILTVIRQEGKARGEIKATAVSVQEQLLKHSSLTAQEEGHTHRVIYESAIKSVNEILMV